MGSTNPRRDEGDGGVIDWIGVDEMQGTRFLYRRGSGSRRRVMHLAHYDGFGEIDRAWCGRNDYNTTINVPLGQPRCKDCLRKMSEASR